MDMITNAERQILEKTRSNYAKQSKYQGKNMPMISWDTLHLESEALGNQSVIQFEVNENNNRVPLSPSEIRLNQTDRFVATRASVKMYKVPSGEVRGEQPLYTWPNPQVFTGGEDDPLRAIFRGYLKVEIDSTVYFPRMDTWQFYFVPGAQELVALTQTTALPAGSAGNWVADEQNGAKDGWVMLTPPVNISGGQKNDLQVILPQASDMTDTTGDGNYCTLTLRGFLVQNVQRQ